MWRASTLLASVLLALSLVSCSPERPSLGPAADHAAAAGGTPGSAPPPDRADCATTIGPGPATVTLLAPSEGEPVPCTAVAAHHAIEVVNATGEALDLTVGPITIPVASARRHLLPSAPSPLVGGPNRLVAAGRTLGIVWLVEPTENTLAGTSIGLSSIGAIELGQAPAEVTAAAGVPVPASGSSCHQTALRGDPYSPLFTFRDGRLVVVQVFTPGLATRSGIAVGSSSADVVAAYGDQITAQAPPDGDPSRELLVFQPQDEDDRIYRLVFDLLDDRVTSMRFGATEIVATAPDC